MSIDLPTCPECGITMQAKYENTGFEPPAGPPHYEISFFFCPVCGVSDEEVEDEKPKTN